MGAPATLPTYTGVVDQNVFILPLGGDRHPQNYLDRFPEEVYRKSPDSHLIKFMYTLMGPAGTGWLRKNYFEARVLLEDFGLELFDLDAFFGNPFQLGRIFTEIYDEDPRGIFPREKWNEIRTKDASYRNRALDYIAGVRLGGTPKGMHHVARSGLGHEVEIIENYKALFDEHSDDPIGYTFYGKTRSTEEMIVLPRREISQSEVQRITLTGYPTSGTFRLYLNGETTPHIAFDALAITVQEMLETLSSIVPGDVRVEGGPGPDTPWTVYFTGGLAATDVPQLVAENYLTGGTDSKVLIETVQGGIPEDEVVRIAPRDQYHLREALERIKPVTAIPTFGTAPGLQKRQVWNAVFASSEYDEVVRYVTGNPSVAWPSRNNFYWIEPGVEHEAPRSSESLSYHYQGFHTPTTVKAYTDQYTEEAGYEEGTLSDQTYATHKSEHIGRFSPLQGLVLPFLNESVDDQEQFVADKCLADYAEPLTIRSVIEDANENARQLVNGIYPLEYSDLPGVATIKYREAQFWASLERRAGTEYLEIDLGQARAVNNISFEVTRKPIDISVHYDLLDMAPRRRWTPVYYPAVEDNPTSISFAPEDLNPWFYVNLSFRDGKGNIPFTRFVRIGFTRRNDINSPFVAEDGTLYPWSIEVQNLRIGRNVGN